MMTRKPVPSNQNPAAPKVQTQAQLPYPASSPQANAQFNNQPRIPGVHDTGEGWEDIGMDIHNDASTGPFGSRTGVEANAEGSVAQQDVPSLLRVGRPEGISRSSFGSYSSGELFPQSSDIEHDLSRRQSPKPAYSTNPYHRPRSAERVQPDVLRSQEESSSNIWAEFEGAALSEPVQAPPPPPPISYDIGGFEDLSLTGHDLHTTSATFEPINQHMVTSSDDDQPISFEEPGQYDPESAIPQSPSVFHDSQSRTNSLIAQTRWMNQDHSDSVTRQSMVPAPAMGGNNRTKLDHQFQPQPEPRSQGPPALPQRSLGTSPPQLPPRRSHEEDSAPPQPPRPAQIQTSDAVSGRTSSRTTVESPGTRAIRQRSETYQIKHINWVDSLGNTRTSPIMVQNANGPCPLLALVNALTLSTAMNQNTALVETLRVREQVSLGLLLDAVFDELMSGRRGDAAQELPDVGELYTFLITLHTGMNVNPRFMSTPSESSSLLELENSREESSRLESTQAGGFEETKEMKLYSTFSIPLIHGWLPPISDPAYAALRRSARTYEDAQNLMFREEELEDKLENQGLSIEEQRLLGDITSIEYFLSTSATQLTTKGLTAITNAVRPGSVAILFRNDHFSTLYRHPRSGQLLTLVTDMGYAGHDEVVWESLVDVSGEGSQFYAGDFRPVGNNDTTVSSTYTDNPNAGPSDAQGWETVTRPIYRKKQAAPHPNPSSSFSTSSNPQRLPTPPSSMEDYNLPPSTTEQQDHDLALALQLQEEEEDRSRRETQARQRENDLSTAYLSSQPQPSPSSSGPTQPSSSNSRTTGNRAQGQTVRPLVPPRGGGAVAANPTRRPPPAARLDPEAGDDAPPPTYEQAAKSEPYVPRPGEVFPPVGGPVDNARGDSVSIGGSGIGSERMQGRPRQGSAYSQHAAQVGNIYGGGQRRGGAGRGGRGAGEGVVRRRSAGLGPGVGSWEDEDRRDKDCGVM